MSGFSALTALILGGAIAASASPAALAQAPQKHGDQCFYSRDMNGFSAPDDHTVYVRVGVSDIYRLDLMSDCTGLTFKQGIGLETTPGDSWVCSPLDATVVYHDVGMPQRCPVTAIHKLTPAESTALPKRDRP